MIASYLLKRPITETYRYAPYAPIRVAVIGSGVGAENVLDCALQNAQTPALLNQSHYASPISCRVFWTLEFAKSYVEARPELKNYFSLEWRYDGMRGSSTTRKGVRPLGAITFTCFDERESCDRGLVAALDENLHFAFVSRNDESDYELASRIADKRPNAAVHVAKLCNYPTCKDSRLGVYDSNQISDLETLVDAMTRRIDEVWMKTVPTVDQDRVKNQPVSAPANNYFYKASRFLACALGDLLKAFKLTCDLLDDAARREAAEELRIILENKESTRAILAYAMHNRWLARMICDGWKAYDDMQDVFLFGAKCVARKQHAALVPARMEAPLLDPRALEYFVCEASPSELNQLDELDFVNVRILRQQFSGRIPVDVDGNFDSARMRVFKANDYAIARNLPYVLTGEKSLLTI